MTVITAHPQTNTTSVQLQQTWLNDALHLQKQTRTVVVEIAHPQCMYTVVSWGTKQATIDLCLTAHCLLICLVVDLCMSNNKHEDSPSEHDLNSLC